MSWHILAFVIDWAWMLLLPLGLALLFNKSPKDLLALFAKTPNATLTAKKIPTKGADGSENGYVVPIWNANEQPSLRPDQVYLTVVAPHLSKGPHLHKKRRGRFCCIKGNVRIVTRHKKRKCQGGGKWGENRGKVGGSIHQATLRRGQRLCAYHCGAWNASLYLQRLGR